MLKLKFFIKYTEYVSKKVLKSFKIAVVAACLSLAMFGQNTFILAQGTFSVTVVSTTATQAVLSFTAPDTNACTVEVSESAGYSPVVHDVDNALFSGSNLDSRSSGVGAGTINRVIVVGKRAAEKAGDNKFYSRALQAYTAHYFRITCGSSVGTGTFTTSNIPLGNNYPETLPGDPLNPGAYAYPTLSGTDRTQQIIDPQTGLLIKPMTLPSDNLDSGHVNFTAAGFANHCSTQLVADSLGSQGYHCLIGTTLFWINASTGESRPLTQIGIPNNPDEDLEGGSCYWGSTLDFSKPGTFYCGVDDGEFNTPSNRLYVQVDYHGSNAVGNGSVLMRECNGSNTPCLQYTLLNPSNNDIPKQITAFDSRFTGFLTDYGCYISAIQNNHLLLYCSRASQDTVSWVAIFDLTSKSIVAAMPTYSASPLRWGVLHSIDYVGDTDWMAFIQNTVARYPGTAYSSAMTQDVSAALASCPTNSFGASGSNCTDIHVDGQPCGASPESTNESTNPGKCVDSSRQYFLQDAQIGDYAQFGARYAPNSETVRIISINGNVWTVQRNITTTDWIVSPRIQPAGTLLTMVGSFASTGGLSWYWDYINDPHGLNSGGATIVQDANFNGNHKVYRPSISVEGNRIRVGAIPDFINAAIIPVNEDGPFAGLTEDSYNSLPWSVDEHPSEAFSNQWFLDGRPWQGGRWPNSPGQALSGSLYKFTSNAFGGTGTQTDLHPNLVPTLATSGRYVLADISGAASVITGNIGDNYKYCIARKSGECFSGSSVGDVFVNAPNVVTPQCVNAGQSGGDGWSAQDICIGDNGSRTNTIIQQGIGVSDAVGITGRVLSRGFVQYRRQDPYWNVHALPNAAWFMFQVPTSVDYSAASGLLFIAKMLPFPASDGVDRTNFLSVPVTIPAPAITSAVSARILFGYAENGSSSQFNCTSRKESCVATNQSNHGYGFLSDILTPVACSNGCTITVPTVPDRIVYIKSQYLNAGGAVVQENSIQVGTGEPPYSVSSLSITDATPPVVSAIASASITQTGVTVSWTTDEAADTQVDYGTTTSYGSSTALNTTLALTHTVSLSSLASGTLYHFRVESRDLAGNIAVSADQTLTTTAVVVQGGGGGGGYLPPAPNPVPTPAPTPTLAPTPTSTPAALVINLKLINNNGTYYLIDHNVRHGITNPGMLSTYGFSFIDAKTATLQENSLPEGGILTPSDGALVKSKEDQTVYLISKQQRYAFTSATVFLALGFKFSSVLLVTNPELQQLAKAENISNSNQAHLPGSDISINGQIDWVGYDNQLHPYPNLAIYNSWHITGDFSTVLIGNDQDKTIPVGSVVSVRVVE
jgi:hypothetical protein